VSSDPLLGPLQNNGGPTSTQALGAGSPAIDAAAPTTAASPCPPPGVDQRSAPRPFNGRCDIGAFEFGATPPSGGGTVISVLTAQGVNFTGQNGIAITAVVATFTDSQPTGNPSSYSASIGWGDGQSSAGTIIPTITGGKVQGTHTYNLPGFYTVTTTIRKTDGAVATATATAHIVVHYRIEAKAFIPFLVVVDPVLHFEWLTYQQTSTYDNPIFNEAQCVSVKQSDQANTWVSTHYVGDIHAGFPGFWRSDNVLDFDWDGTGITNAMQTRSEGTTHRVKVYWINGKIKFCIQQDTAKLDGSVSRQTGPNSFSVQIGGPAGINPMVPYQPAPFIINLNGTANPDFGLSLSYTTSGFPSWGLEVTRNGQRALTDVINDVSCLGPTDVLETNGVVNLSLGLARFKSKANLGVSLTGSTPPANHWATLCTQNAGNLFGILPTSSSPPGTAAALVSAATGTTFSPTGSTSGRLTPSRSATSSTSPTTSSSLTTSSTTGTIAGTVTDASGQGLVNICVAATNPFGAVYSSTVTARGGSYALSGLAPGAWLVRFAECGGGTHLSQWFNGKATAVGADQVVVNAGATTSGINASLAGGGGTVAGLVTDSSSGAPLANICVHAQDSRGDFADAQATGKTGTYKVGGLPAGNYVVSFSDCPRSDYLPQIYKNAGSTRTATLVAVTLGTNMPNINASLTLGGQVTGMVTDTANTVLPNICVVAVQASTGAVVDSTQTNTSGAYLLDQLPAGKYLVEFSDCNGGNHLAATTANQVTVTNGATTSGINTALSLGATITGTITDTSGQPVTGACAKVESTTAGGPRSLSGQTGSTGAYTVASLPSGAYTVEFLDCAGGNHAPQWFNAQASLGSANPVTVTAGATTSNINGQLPGGGVIAGNVTAAAAPVADLCIMVQDPAGNFVIGGGTDTSGNYTITGLTAGSYVVDFKDCLGGNHVEQTAGPVSVTAGATTTVNAALVLTGSIHGTVTDASSHPLIDVCVSTQSTATGAATMATTDSAGAYTITGLPAGGYTVQFRGCSVANANFVMQWFGGALNPGGATIVNVSAAVTTNGINASLANGGSIAGTVTDSAGAAASNICVAGMPNGTAIAAPVGTATDANGRYTLPGLASGNYALVFSDCTGGSHLNASSGTLAVSAPGAVTGVNVQVASGGTITGLITDLGNGFPVPGTCIDAFPTGASNPTGSTIDNADGTYSLGPLPPGAYNVEFSDCAGGGHTTQWANNKTSQGAADVITVNAGTATSGVNAALSP
jgi:hypothetical protein